jgi:hypothetical protein
MSFINIFYDLSLMQEGLSTWASTELTDEYNYLYGEITQDLTNLYNEYYNEYGYYFYNEYEATMSTTSSETATNDAMTDSFGNFGCRLAAIAAKTNNHKLSAIANFIQTNHSALKYFSETRGDVSPVELIKHLLSVLSIAFIKKSS